MFVVVVLLLIFRLKASQNAHIHMCNVRYDLIHRNVCVCLIRVLSRSVSVVERLSAQSGLVNHLTLPRKHQRTYVPCQTVSSSLVPLLHGLPTRCSTFATAQNIEKIKQYIFFLLKHIV